ncbi:MAG: hypothetical protein U0L77_08180 [Prevotellamassilia sp.]|nr:hypothetical protein [Prevotellamassilia sp.]
MLNFSYSRFCSVLRRDLVEHCRTYVAFFAVLFIANTLTHFLCNAIEELPVRFFVQLFCVAVIQIIGSCYALSLVYADLDTKEHRISNFMLPASNLEKATVRHLLAILGFQLMFLTSYLCSELINALYTLVAHGAGTVAQNSLLLQLGEVCKLFTFYAELEEVLPAAPYLILACHLLACSLYILGSAFFRKKAFLKVTVVMLFVNPGIFLNIPASFSNFFLSHPAILMFYSLLIGALVVGVIYFAYRRYCRIQVL